jgi:hypothetical protein
MSTMAGATIIMALTSGALVRESSKIGRSVPSQSSSSIANSQFAHQTSPRITAISMMPRHSCLVAHSSKPHTSNRSDAAQIRLHRLLVELVLELDEPYRSTIIARFVEGRTSASIAQSRHPRRHGAEATSRGALEAASRVGYQR